MNEAEQKIDGEMEHVKQIITILEELKKCVMEHREKVFTVQQNVNIQIKETEKKAEEFTRWDKEKKIRQIHALKQTEIQHEELLNNTVKLLNTTETMINKMTEKKGNLETDNTET